MTLKQLRFFLGVALFACVQQAVADDLATPLMTQDMPRIKLEPMFRLARPTYAIHDPAGRMFFLEQPGRVRLMEDGKIVETPYLDISKKVLVDYECGLLSIAFHPKFAENGYIYANYTMKMPNVRTVIAEYHVDPNAKQVDISTERILMTISQPYLNHKGGQIQFGPDGYLYIGMGDGGNGRDPHRNAQNPQVLLGKILRIDVTPRQGYGIPKDNPWVEHNTWAPEIYAIGMRNPWRFCFDKETGLFWCADVGQDLWEEVDIIQKGGNYGWSLREGFHDFNPPTTPPLPKPTDPIFEYAHNRNAASITGGLVYHGKKIPGLQGWYIFADYSQGTIYGIKYENGKLTGSGLIVNPKDPTRKGGTRNPTQASAFGELPDGEMVMCDNNGPIYRILPDDAPPPSPEK